MTPEEQRTIALARANEVREARADLKRELRFGLTGLHEALERPCVQNMQIVRLLEALPTVRHVKANKVLGRLAISPTRRIGQLTSRQRAELVEAMP